MMPNATLVSVFFYSGNGWFSPSCCMVYIMINLPKVIAFMCMATIVLKYGLSAAYADAVI